MNVIAQLWQAFCLSQAARYDARCIDYIRNRDPISYRECAELGDRWWKRAGGLGR
jgi:hypothetical protein